MAPIRVGLIGLTVGDGKSIGAGSWGINAHLPTYLLSPHYEITALCNSSVESAKRSIEYHKLPATTKAYGNPEDIAKDPDVDIVCVSVFVGQHYNLAMPALRAKKQVFVEWPLGATTAEAEEMTKLAKDAGLKTAAGMQMRADPIVAKAKQLINSGAIGKVNSTTVTGCFNLFPSDTWMAGPAEYYLDFETGGNEFHIGLAHFLDAFIYVLGDFDTLHSVLDIQYPVVKLVDLKTGEVADPARKRTAPDHHFVLGKLESGAVASLAFRKTNKTADGKGLRWLISGTEGEIELTMDSPMLQMMPTESEHLRMVVGKDGETKDVAFADPKEVDHTKNVGDMGRNTARLFEAYAHNSTQAPTFEDALKLHKLMDRIAAASGFPKKA